MSRAAFSFRSRDVTCVEASLSLSLFSLSLSLFLSFLGRPLLRPRVRLTNFFLHFTCHERDKMEKIKVENESREIRNPV